MEKLKKGDLLYDAFLEVLNDKLEEELVFDDKFLKGLQIGHNEMYEKINAENEKNATISGEFDFDKEHDSYNGLYYNIYLFIEWLNRAL